MTLYQTLPFSSLRHIYITNNRTVNFVFCVILLDNGMLLEHWQSYFIKPFQFCLHVFHSNLSPLGSGPDCYTILWGHNITLHSSKNATSLNSIQVHTSVFKFSLCIFERFRLHKYAFQNTFVLLNDMFFSIWREWFNNDHMQNKSDNSEQNDPPEHTASDPRVVLKQ